MIFVEQTMERVNRIYFDRQYQQLLRELTAVESERIFCRHTLQHFLDTARLMYILSLEEHLNFSKDLIYATALLHDIGRLSQYREGIDHDKAGADFARTLMPKCGYTVDETEQVCRAIESHSHKSRQNNPSDLGKLLYRADKLSRNCFDCAAYGECYWTEERKNTEIRY